VAGIGLTSEIIYWLVFVRPFPLAGLYDTLPPVDYAKLTDHSVRGAISFTLAIVALFAVYLMALYYARRAQTRWMWGIVLAGAVVMGATLVPAYPTTAIDLLIYAVRARIWAIYNLNPLATAPLQLPADPWIGLAGEWADIPSPYGPVWEGISLLAFRLVGGDLLRHLLALKAVAFLSHLGCVGLVGLILRRLKPDWALVGTLALAWNPLALLELAGNGHNDGLMVLFLLLAIYLAVSGRRWLVIPALTLSIFTKFTPLLALPFFLLYLARLAGAGSSRPRLAQIASVAGNTALFGGLGLAVMAPIWPGWEHWAVRDLGQAAGRSPFALLVLALAMALPVNTAFDVTTYLMDGLFLAVYAWLAWRAVAGPPGAQPPFGSAQPPLGSAQPPLGTLTDTVLAPTFGAFFWYLVLANQQFHAWYLLWPLAVAVLLGPTPALTRMVVFGCTALLAITIYETLRYWWGGLFNPLVTHLVAVPLVFGPPLLVGIKDLTLRRSGER
jgi:alpha-1,6-mannosyltransferase